MLKKLLKYDLTNIFKFLITFYSLALFFAILTRIFFQITNSFIMNLIGHICSGATIFMLASILINNIMRAWVRFKQNLYGDESYLTHTLPCPKQTLYSSKIITTIISLFISIFVIALTIFIAYYSQENIEFLKNILLPLTTTYHGTIIKILLAFFFIFFLELATALQSGYTGIILGHKMDQGKLSFSILFGFITYMVTQLFTLTIIFIVALFNQDLMNLFLTNEIISIDMIKIIIYLATTIYSINLIIGYFLNIKLFNQGVNVD